MAVVRRARRRDGAYALKIHRGKHILVTEEVAALLDPILRSELERMHSEADDWALLLDHLDTAGPSEVEDLREELGLSSKALKAITSPLERCGVARQPLARRVGDGPRAPSAHDGARPLGPGLHRALGRAEASRI